MSEVERKHTKKVSRPAGKVVAPIKSKPIQLPPQNGPRDTSNWDNKVYRTPDGRRIIETDQNKKQVDIAE